MATLINKNKEIDVRRQLDVEHQFEAMVGARKRRYNDTPAQKQRTEFLEDYYLLYTRNKKKLAEFEDFMEEQGFESLEDLQNVIGYNYFADNQIKYIKQVRKEVCDYIKHRLDNIEVETNTDYNSFIAILEEIEQGEKKV